MPLQPDGRLIKNGITLLSGVDPAGRAKKIVNSIAIKDRTLYLCPSPLYGYGFSDLLSKIELQAPNSAVLCIEADPELYELSLKNIETSLLNNKLLRLTNICDGETLYSFICKNWGQMAFRRIEIIKLTGGWQLFPKVYDFLCNYIQSEIATDWSNALTLTKLGRLYIRNTLRNLAFFSHFLSHSIEELSFGSDPVLVLGAGPSLDETLDTLNRYFPPLEKRPFKIICVDTCLYAFKERNITPDLAVILESQFWNLRDFIGCKGWNVDTVIDISSLPASARLLTGNKYLFMTPWTKLKIFDRLKERNLFPSNIAPLGSVGLTAVELARRLTNGNIICAGLDFSFTDDKYHAKSTPGHKNKLNLQTRFKRILNTIAYEKHSLTAVSKSGLPVKTNAVMRGYRDLFEQEFSGDNRLFDIEGSGLPLGVKTLSMEEAILTLKNNTNFISQRRRTKGSQGAEDTEEEELKKLTPCAPFSPCLRVKNSELIKFYNIEIKLLKELKDLLTGDEAMNQQRLTELIEECDYIWAHFPDYSGGRKPNINDVSFLKRIRAEIDPMLKLLERVKKDI
ncbi:MAG: DUF115 domain-containing protein [Treponema sp.]|nr:DUF115 domain-containing protein [Treponema sp.]